MKTADLTGAALDWAVSKCEGEHYSAVTTYNGIGQESPPTNYSTDWAQGGPIIEREKMDFRWVGINNCRAATEWLDEKHFESFGPTPLIAAMRCYVTSKLGDELEIPKELIK